VLGVLVILMADVKKILEGVDGRESQLGVLLDGQFDLLLEIMAETSGGRHDCQLSNVDGFQISVQVPQFGGNTCGRGIWVNGEIHELVSDVHLSCTGHQLKFLLDTFKHCMRQVQILQIGN
jgi:hypothetical protein